MSNCWAFCETYYIPTRKVYVIVLPYNFFCKKVNFFAVFNAFLLENKNIKKTSKKRLKNVAATLSHLSMNADPCN